MDQGLSIAISGLNASMAQIDAATQNIANSQTPGYVTESATLAAVPGGGTVDVGGGVQVTSISQANDLLLSANNLQAQGSLSNLGALQQVLTGIQDVFPLGQNSSASTTQSANTSIAGQLSNFWSAWDAIAQDPSSLAPRTQIVDMAQGLATSLNEASTQLGQLATNTASELNSNVGQTNSLLGQVASLNQSIVTAGTGGSGASALNDQLQNALGQLASLAGVNVTMQQNGTAQVSVGGVTLVQGNTADTLGAGLSTTGELSVAAYPTAADALANTNGVTVPVGSGSIAGQLTGLNVTIPKYQASLNTVASDLATTVNNQLALGLTASGISGATLPLFTTAGGGTSGITAANVTVSSALVQDPSNLAASGATTLVSVVPPPASSPAPTTSQAPNATASTDSGAVMVPGPAFVETLAFSQNPVNSSGHFNAETPVSISISAPATSGPPASVASSVAQQLNTGFNLQSIALDALVVNNGTQVQLVSTAPAGTATFTVTLLSTSTGTDPTGLAGPSAAGLTFGAALIGANDASNAQAMAELGTAAAGPDLAYQNLVQGIGADTQNANSQLASQTSVASQAQQALQAVSGVNQNTQLTDLMQYQANYQASAKVVSVIDQTLQSLLAAV